MRTFRFLDFKVYKESVVFHKMIVEITKLFPREYWYLKDQLRRASLSVVLSIAEGSAKRSDKDFNRYLEIALGSMDETIAGCDVAYTIGLLNNEMLSTIFQKAESVKKQLGGFSRKLLSC